MDDTLPLIQYKIPDEVTLYKAYMPYIEHGGLFVKGKPNRAIGESVNIELDLYTETHPVVFTGKVVWVSPVESKEFPQGMGIQFPDTTDIQQLRNKIISAVVSESKKAENTTDTF